jgi:hypothetical protein
MLPVGSSFGHPQSVDKYIYPNAIPGVMHALAKWIESDSVFDTLGLLILGTGLFVLVSLTIYACGFLT